MANINKIIKSKNPPKQTNVAWVDLSGETPIEKHFINGRWVAVSGGGNIPDLSQYQKKLVAGENITIDNETNTISASSGVEQEPIAIGLELRDYSVLDFCDIMTSAVAEAYQSGRRVILDPSLVTSETNTGTNTVGSSSIILPIINYIPDGGTTHQRYELTELDWTTVPGFYPNRAFSRAVFGMVGWELEDETYVFKNYIADFNGTYPNLVAGDLIPKNTSPILFTHKYAAQTTGGDADIQNGDALLDSIKGNLVNINGVLTPFLADTFVSTGMNLVNPTNYLTIGGRKAYYFPVVAGIWGEYGTTEQNNGYKILATTTPYAINFSQTKPTTSAYGTACTYHTYNSVNYYTPANNGWLVIIMPDDVVPACHLEWSGKFEDEAGTFSNTTKSIGTAITAVHAWGLSSIVGANRSSFDELDFVAGKGYARNDRVLLSALTWTKTVITDNTDSESPVTHYIYTATISGMANNGLWDCLYEDLVVDNITLTIESDVISSVEDLVATFGASEYFYYQKATVTSSNISGAATIRANTVNDYGISYFLNNNELATVPAFVTEEFYQGGKDQIFNNIAYTQGEMSEVIAAVLAEHEEKINSILESFHRGLPLLRVEELIIARRLDAYIKEGNALTSGAGAPTIIPIFNGQEYFDTTNEVWYKASFTGTEPTAAGWKLITNT